MNKEVTPELIQEYNYIYLIQERERWATGPARVVIRRLYSSP